MPTVQEAKSTDAGVVAKLIEYVPFAFPALRGGTGYVWM
jgi:hypothetical protein